MDHIAKLVGQSDQLSAATERAQADPSPINRLAATEVSLELLASQALAITKSLTKLQEIGLIHLVRTGNSQAVSNGVTFLKDGSFLSVVISERSELRVRLADAARVVLAAKENPIRTDIKKVDAVNVLDIEILELQRAGEVYVQHSFPMLTAGGSEETLTIEFSFASLGGSLDSPVRLCWSLSRSEGSRDE